MSSIEAQGTVRAIEHRMNESPAVAHAPRREVKPPNHRRRNLITGCIAVAALAIGAYGWRAHSRNVAPRFRFELAAVDRGPIRAKITATGIVNPLVTVQVGTQVSGTILKLGADFNSQVTPGQVIAEIDPRLFRAAVAQADANLRAAQANRNKERVQLVDAQRSAARNREMVAQHLIAQSTADATDTAAAVVRADLQQAMAAEAQAKAALDTASLELSFTTIVSPIAGTVITRNIDIGQTVAASFAAPTLFVIGQDLTKMEVDTSIAEADVGSLKAGMTATFTVDAYPTRVFSGAIRQLRTSPQIVQNVVTYNAVVDVANPTLELKPGMTANLEVIYADEPDVLRVANAALRFRPSPALVGKSPLVAGPGKKLVWMMQSGVPHALEITTGISDGTSTEVVAGALRAGDQVVTEANPTTKARTP
jgi:HlyD family secretion protein